MELLAEKPEVGGEKKAKERGSGTARGFALKILHQHSVAGKELFINLQPKEKHKWTNATMNRALNKLVEEQLVFRDDKGMFILAGKRNNTAEKSGVASGATSQVGGVGGEGSGGGVAVRPVAAQPVGLYTEQDSTNAGGGGESNKRRNVTDIAHQVRATGCGYLPGGPGWGDTSKTVGQTPPP